YNFKSPKKNVSLYTEMGVDIVSLANNHSFDFGDKSFTDTADTLSESGIAYTGAGLNAEEAAKPVYFIVNGRKIAYLAVCDTVYPKATAATASGAGIFSLRNMDAVTEAIKAADAVSDYVMVYTHWGHENSKWFASEPTVCDQSGWGRTMIDAGADAVIGSHPHVLQGMEYHDGKIIAYSLGNFWFNGKTMDTGLLRIRFSNNGEMQCSFAPCVQSDGTVTAITDEAAKRELFTSIETHSGGFVSIDNDGIITAVKDTKGM
ncbi:MAG: CapA family protein, partial [Oscillospiraceae bacterium]|nr:CapA family protein [Oscillospiraceae bacterium]